jgi:hypothetical protein
MLRMFLTLRAFIVQEVEDELWQPLPSESIRCVYPAVAGRIMSNFAAAGTLCQSTILSILSFFDLVF